MAISREACRGIFRKTFVKMEDSVPVPNLIEIQSRSFNEFVQLDYLATERENIGLEKVLRDIFPIEYNDKMSLEYVGYELGSWACTCGKIKGIESRYSWHCALTGKSGCSRLSSDLSAPKTARYKTCTNCLSRVSIQLPMSVDDCRLNGQTFSVPLKVKIQLISWDGEGKDKIVRDIKEQDIFFADIPIMVDIYEKLGRIEVGTEGTFLINGVDRVVVSQLHRSPGVVFSQSKKIKDLRGRPYYIARMIPMRGSWIDFEFDNNDHLYVRIDKKKKILSTTFLQGLGFEREKILSLFYENELINYENNSFYKNIDKNILGIRIEKGMLPEKYESKYLNKRITSDIITDLNKNNINKFDIDSASLIGRVFSSDIIDDITGEIIVEQGQVFDESILKLFKKNDKDLNCKFVSTSGYAFQPSMATTLVADHCFSQEDALKDIHTKIWPGDNSSLEEVKERLENIFFNSRFYDLTKVGRIRINRKFGISVPESNFALTREDIVATIKYLVNLRERGEGELDDIDHLGNRRVRLVGELLSNQVYVGFLRIERIVRERFRMQEADGTVMPQDLLNVKPLSAVLREFFGTGQLSQFMDQTNPLAEIAHKRRLSALGPGGVMKDRATFEVRDVHTSHYGRICPIETPEGQTVGLISSLSTYATVNDLGFIETAYRPVKNGVIQSEVLFLDAISESNKYIAQADAVEPGEKIITSKTVVVRHNSNFQVANTSKVDLIDLSPKQLVSVSTALIPFLEHDDASRALMGSNMQRQAVPLIKASAPLVGTGMEKEIAKSSSAVIFAVRPGLIEYVSSDKIVVRVDESAFDSIDDWITHGVDVYHLKKFQKSSMSTWIHHVPLVIKGDRVKTGDVLTNGSSMENGELALGANILVAFMPWSGYNFEDAIVISKRLVSDDILTSVNIDEYIIDARDTKLGPEEITRDIPNVGESSLVNLDEDGIIKVGARVKPGDILVGKVTLKGDVQYSPEEKLLRAIFGEKSREVRDTSLRVPPGVDGMVVDVRVFSRSGIRKDKRYKDVVTEQIKKLEKDFSQHEQCLKSMIFNKIVNLISGQKPNMDKNLELLVNGLYDKDRLTPLSQEELFSLRVSNKDLNEEINHLLSSLENQIGVLLGLKEEKISRFKKGDPLPSGVIKMVKVYIAMKRHISVGDKIAGRHGNKGVVSIIIPREDMPFMDDGTPVDIVLNPLGVPSRMNVGQILETILGFAGMSVGIKLKQMLQTDGYDSVKTFLQKYYDLEFINEFEKTNGQDSVLELARKISKTGMKYTVPVFEGLVFERDIKPLLKDIGLSTSGAYKIRDGRTGEYFDQEVTVGSVYIMKLNHMVDDKMHARSVGPYSLVTQQPLRGKSKFGGQRLGEMEVWALEAYGAAFTLQEMLTYKSDDVTGRHKVYEAIVRGDDIPEAGLPESFNVLIKELQSLSLQVDLCKVGKEELSE